MIESEPKSPCISVCVLNTADVCLGCYRSAEEIMEWVMASAADKRAIIARAHHRMLADKPIRLK